MTTRYDHVYEAASRYYLQGDTMEAIARSLGVSRSTVSRLLVQARETGLVRISLADSSGSRAPAARSLADIFGVHVHLATVGESASDAVRLDKVSRLAAGVVQGVVADDQIIGAAWGVTLANVVQHVNARPLRSSVVVQMNGGTNRYDSNTPYIGAILQALGAALDARVVLFPVPAFFDYPETKRAMWRERSVRHVLSLQAKLDVAIFGVGSLTGRVPSHVYTAGHLDADDIAQLRREGAVGDVCTVLLREDGSYADISYNERATGLPPPELRRVPRRICVVADPLRAPALLGALRAGVVTDLVVDEATARAVLERL